MNSTALEGVEPRSVWQFFAQLSAVPRPSKREERAQQFVLDVAKQHGLSADVDGVGNVVITVPASPGHERAPITVLQGHLDMVCEKNSGTEHDFDHEGIRLVRDKDAKGEAILRADGTTLGADNGIGVAMALAAATSDNVVHGPLELLFTLDEEAGMTGAKGLTPDAFKGRRLLNLDSEEDDAIYIGCAGGSDTNLSWCFETESPVAEGACFEVRVSGLRGGHSGCDIHEGRGSAIKLLTRVVGRSGAEGLRLGLIDGGSMRNAIPREARAVFFAPNAAHAALSRAATEVTEEAVTESNEREAVITVSRMGDNRPGCCLNRVDTARVFDALCALPNGVLGMHPKVPGLVETSNNVSTVKMDDSSKGSLTINIGTLSRSSSKSRLKETLAQIAAVGGLTGAKVSNANGYPGWNPNPDSSLLASCKRIYNEQFGREPHVMAIHAGLECGLIGELVGGMDMVSFGPRIEGAHSPDERVYIESVAVIWDYLKSVLAELAKG